MREEEIKAMGNIIYSSYLLRNNAHNLAATQLYDAGWRKQVEAEWKPIKQYSERWGVETINYYRCSNCDNFQYTNNVNYCPKCGARMVGRR